MTDWFPGFRTSYQQTLETHRLIKDVTKAQRESGAETIKAMDVNTRQLLFGMAAGADQISESLKRSSGDITQSITKFSASINGINESINGVNESINGMNSSLAAMNASLGQISSSFRWGFGQILGILGGMSDELNTLVKIAKTPAQTAAYEQFDIARDAFRQGLYPECLEALDRAIHGDHNSTGYKLEWRFYNLIGIVRLGFNGCDTDLVDLEKSEKAFLLAARYAKANAPSDAARAMLAAGRAALVQSNYRQAMEYSVSAIELDEGLAEGFYQAAQASMMLQDYDTGFEILRRAIDSDINYLIKAGGDALFTQQQSILDSFIVSMRDEKLRILQKPTLDALALVAPNFEKWKSIATHPAISRWRAIAGGAKDWGYFDLFQYHRQGFNVDKRTIWDCIRKEQAADTLREKKWLQESSVCTKCQKRVLSNTTYVTQGGLICQACYGYYR